MAEYLKAKQPEEIKALLDYVHDRSYRLTDVSLNADRAQLTVPISVRTRENRVVLGIQIPRTGKARALLKINHAHRYVVEDGAEIGEGDICSIKFEDGKVILVGSLPVNMYIDVDALDIELELPPNVHFA